MGENFLEELDYIPRFITRIDNEEFCITKDDLKTMQINVGNLCNLACKHCHVEAGPHGKNIMDLDTIKDCLEVFSQNKFSALDITGGAPEMNPSFEYLVESGRKLAEKVIVRTNLVILSEEKYSHLPEFYRDNKVEVVCSLPYFTKNDTDRQRGKDVFDKSIEILQRLNKLGYGSDPDLVLNLVYNPGGAFLPPSQNELTSEYKTRLFKRHGIVFNKLFTITNNPVGRFGDFLKSSENLEQYMKKLSGSFNKSTVEGMMCRDQLSIAWNGELYDCDFNQTIKLKANGEDHIGNLKGRQGLKRQICFGNHCYACTAGSGSSCTGTTA